MVKLVLAVLAAAVSAAAPFKEAAEVRSLIRFDKATPDAWAPMRSLLSNEIFLIAQMSKSQRLSMKRQTWAWAKAKKVNQRETWAWASAKKATGDPYANAAEMDEAAVREKFAPACADTLESIAENMLAHTPDRQFTESPDLLGLSLSTHLQVICQTLPIPEDECDAAATQLYRLVAAGRPLVPKEPEPETESAPKKEVEPGCEKCPDLCKSEADALVAACAPCETCPRVNPCAPVCPPNPCGTKAEKLWLSSSFGLPVCSKCSACYYPEDPEETEEPSEKEIETMSDILHHIGTKIGWNPPAQPPAEQKSAEEKPAEEPAAEEKPAEEPAAEEKPAEEKPAEEKPAEEKPAEEKPAETPPVGTVTEKPNILEHLGNKLGINSQPGETTIGVGVLLQRAARSAPLPLGATPAEPTVPADGVEWCGSFFDLFFSAVLEKMAEKGKTAFLQKQ